MGLAVKVSALRQEPNTGIGVTLPPKWDAGMPAEEDYTAKEAEYRTHAVELLQLAEQSQDVHERDTLLRMAEAWLQLASRMNDLCARDK